MSPVPPPLPSAGKSRLQMFVIGLSLLLFLISLALPVLRLEGTAAWGGLMIFCLGWLGVFYGMFAWLANPLLLASWVLLLINRHMTALMISIVAVLIGLQSLMIAGLLIPLDEGGVNKTTVLGIGAAFPVWLAGLAVPGLGAVMMAVKNRSHAHSEER